MTRMYFHVSCSDYILRSYTKHCLWMIVSTVVSVIHSQYRLAGGVSINNNILYMLHILVVSTGVVLDTTLSLSHIVTTCHTSVIKM